MRDFLGAALEVHRILGPGFLESIYEEALAVELLQRSIPFERQVGVDLIYKGRSVGSGRVDLLIARYLVVELKTAEQLSDVHVCQVLSYLRALNLQLGLLITFNVPLLRKGVRRVVLTRRSS